MEDDEEMDELMEETMEDQPGPSNAEASNKKKAPKKKRIRKLKTTNETETHFSRVSSVDASHDTETLPIHCSIGR